MRLSEQTEPACPRCGGELAMRDLQSAGRGATVGGCVRCGGLWMRPNDLNRLSEVVSLVLVEWRRLPTPKEQQRVLRCPECNVEMEKFESPRDAHVVLDRCPKCRGIFLDQNELEAIQRESLLAMLASAARA